MATQANKICRGIRVKIPTDHIPSKLGRGHEHHKIRGRFEAGDPGEVNLDGTTRQTQQDNQTSNQD